MRLFDGFARTDLRFAKEREPKFHYCNQSARRSIVVLREMLEAWFERYPGDKRASLRGRFRSENDSQHRSAFFELYVHELFARMSFDLQAEPDLENSSNHPDFLAYLDGAPRFYVEVTLAGLPSQGEYAADRRKAAVYDAINSIDSPNFFLGIDIEGAPTDPPPTKKLRADLMRWLKTLDPDEIGELYKAERYAEIPSWPWRCGGWNIVFKPIPKSPLIRCQPGVRPMGVRVPEAEWLSTQIEIKSAIDTKRKKYGALTLPFLIAVNVVGDHCDNIDIMNALYGDEVTTVRQGPDGSLTESSGRERNGVWLGETGPRSTLVSGILIAAGLHPWNMGTLTPELFLNPWASNPFPTADWPMPYCVCRFEGKSSTSRAR